MESNKKSKCETPAINLLVKDVETQASLSIPLLKEFFMLTYEGDEKEVNEILDSLAEYRKSRGKVTKKLRKIKRRKTAETV
jgi:hypothetical protein